MVKQAKGKGAKGTQRGNKTSSVKKEHKKSQPASEFSHEEMLKNIKKVVEAMGSDIMKPTNEHRDIKAILADKSFQFEEVDMEAKGKLANGKVAKKDESDAADSREEEKKTVKQKGTPKLSKRETKDAPADGNDESVKPKEEPKTSTVKLIFSDVGASEDVFKRVLQNKVSSCGPFLKSWLGKNGKAVVMVANEEIAQKYLNHFNGYELGGKQMAVSIASRKAKKVSPSSEQFKYVTISGIPKAYDREAVVKAFDGVSGVSYSNIEKTEDGNWKVRFETVPDSVKFNALVNGTMLSFLNKKKEVKVKVKCHSESFGKKAAHSGRVFIQNLPFGVKASKIESLVKPFDKKATVTMPSGKKGFAFVQFSNVQVAEKAISKLNGTMVGKRNIRMALSLPSEIYNPKPKAAQLLEDASEEPDLEKMGSNEAGKEASVDGECLALVDDGRTATKGDDMPSVGVRSDKKGTEHQRTIFVRNLSFDATEEALKKYFSAYGAVESCNICRDEKKSSRGTAFVHFSNAEDVQKIMAMEELALERDAEFANGVENGEKPKVKHSATAGIGFSLNGRRLKLSIALTREEASSISKGNLSKKETVQDARKGLHLLMEGVIEENSPEFMKLTPKEQKLQSESLKEKHEKLKNPNMFINPKRICLRNLPPDADVNKLRQAIATHFRRNAKVSKLCGTDKVQASKTIGKVTFLSDEKRKVKVGESTMRRRMPYAFIDFERHELALEAIRFLSNNSDLYGPGNRLFAEFAIEDSRAIYIQNKRKEQYNAKVNGSGASTTGEKRKKRKTYSRGKLQRMKRRKLQQEAVEQPSN